MDKGFISQELVKQVSKQVDKDVNLSKVKLIGPVLELLDDKLVNYSLNYIDDKWGEKVPENARPAIIAILEAYVSGDWSQVDDEVATAANLFIDIPLLDEDFEGNLIKGVVDALIKFVTSKKS